jgi:ribonuclease HI
MEAALNSSLLRRMSTRNDPVQQQGQRKWKPPPPDVLKINIDGAFCVKERKGAWGFVICDTAGQGVLVGSGNLSAVHDSLTVEVEACVEALNTSMVVGISQIIVEKDSTNLVVALQ